jgi:hypothetical protein
MSSFQHFLLPSLCLCFALTACSSTPTTPSTPPTPPTPSYVDVTGNWHFSLASPPTSFKPVSSLSGSLSSSGSVVTGILHANPFAFPFCVEAATDLAVTGTLDTSGNLTLNFPIAGGTGTIVTPMYSLGAYSLGATYQVAGGACAQASVGLDIASNVPNISGTYSGTMIQQPSGSLRSTVTVVLNQSTTPNSDGLYPLSGTVTSTGDCNSTLTFSQGLVTGDTAQSYPSIDPQVGSPVITGAGPVNSYLGASTNPNKFLESSINQLTGCGSTSYIGQLFRQ